VVEKNFLAQLIINPTKEVNVAYHEMETNNCVVNLFYDAGSAGEVIQA
jgi:hypothetical protein